MNNLQQRLLASSVGIPLVLAAIYFSTEPLYRVSFAALLSLIAFFALKEFFAITSVKGAKALTLPTQLFTATLLFSAICLPHIPALSWLIVLIYFLFSFLIFFRSGSEPVTNLGATFFGFLYVTAPLALIALIPGMEEAEKNGRMWLLYLLVVSKSTDTAAFFFGKLLGRRQLAPYISPKKTWEGALFGFAAAIVFSLMFSLVGSHYGFNLSLAGSALLGALLSIGAQIGDLSESLLKRDAQLKDSSSLPGLGGVLDIVDSLVFTSPLLYIWIKYGLSNGVFA
ncbi:phosphatidate cytidylyltransferase [Estrella lausannensis]|uniref:Phosphatidate cytidylyltransferase n=1 Tax=Estrella lausannensis TaxID=483423 RepID=A0A0H5E725_9BACT|nr:CDP-archaeol synthase [Estrella lausannensis]CRX39105.1 Putative phosphatidate cytidylytransferase [Estrella lausannensis]